MQVSVIKGPLLYLDHLCVREPCPSDPTEGPLLLILRVPPGAHRATRCTGTCSHPSVVPFLHIPCWWGRGQEEPTPTWGREAEPASASSRATRLVTRRSLRGPERRVRAGRAAPAHQLPGGTPVQAAQGGWQRGSWPGTFYSLSISQTEDTQAQRGGTATGPHLLPGTTALDRPYAACTGHQVDRMVHAFPPALGICAGSCTRTRAPLGTER